MKRITVPELRYIVNELGFLKTKRIENIYQYGSEIRIIVDKKELFFSPSSFHLTEKPGKRDISSFAMILRKYLRGKSIKNITSKNLVVELVIDSYILVFEIFPRFNCILCDNSYKIIMPMKFYKGIKPEEPYIFPDGPDFKNKERFRKFLSRKYPVSLLIRDYFGRYVRIPREIGEKPGNGLKESERKKILEDIRSLISKGKNPQVVYKNRKIVDALPFDVSSHKNLRKKYFDTFNQALDFFFTKAK